jgi:mannitol/fructose-specific phosphotransferase system IIA component (Ntr-type)
MDLADVILPEAIIPDLRASDRDGVIREMVAAFAPSLKFGNDAVLSVADAVIEREQGGGTAFGKGVAVPHAKHPAIQGVVGTLARSRRCINFRRSIVSRCI